MYNVHKHYERHMYCVYVQRPHPCKRVLINILHTQIRARAYIAFRVG
jgi:hypothetical protein